jgi:uncharacterized protein YqhQ
MSRPFYYGGQAVIEGVLMRGRRSLAIAVRRPQGDILLRSQHVGHPHAHHTQQWPVLRGLLALWETMTMGTQALLFSARVAADQEESSNPPHVWAAITLSLSFVTAVFFVGPLLLTSWLQGVIHQSLVVLFIEGFVRLGMLLGYVAGIGYIPSVNRVFEYHGAEHKTINAYEAGAPLHVHEVRRYSTAHVRCGTGFLLVVMVISVLIFAAIGSPAFWLRLLSRVVLIPLIAAIAYEYVRFTAGHLDNRLIRWLVRPSLALQSFTTREPDDGQLEVAITALQEVLAIDETAEERQTEKTELRVAGPLAAASTAAAGD